MDEAVWATGTRPTPALLRAYVLTLVNVFGNGLVMAYQLIFLTDVRQIDLRVAGLLMGLMGVASLIASPITGTFTDRIGSVNAMSIGFALGIAGWAVLLVGDGVAMSGVAMVLIGLSMGTSWPASGTLVANLTTPETRSRAFAIQRMVINAAIGLGGLVGGFVADAKRPRTFEVLFMADMATFAVAMVLGLHLARVVPRVRSDAATRVEEPGYREVLADRFFSRTLAYDLATGLTFAFAFDLLPKFLTLLGARTNAVGIVFAVNTAAVVLLQLPIVRWTAGRRRLRLLEVQFGVFGVGFVICWLASKVASVWILPFVIVAAIVWSVGECVMGTVRSPMVVDMARPQLVGRYNALTAMMFQLGMSMGRPLGAIALKRGPGPLWLLAVVVSLAGMAYLRGLEGSISDRLRRNPALQ